MKHVTFVVERKENVQHISKKFLLYIIHIYIHTHIYIHIYILTIYMYNAVA